MRRYTTSGIPTHSEKDKTIMVGISVCGTAIEQGGEFDQSFTNLLRAGFWVMRQSRRAFSSRSQTPSECFCGQLQQSARDMRQHPI